MLFYSIGYFTTRQKFTSQNHILSPANCFTFYQQSKQRATSPLPHHPIPPPSPLSFTCVHASYKHDRIHVLVSSLFHPNMMTIGVNALKTYKDWLFPKEKLGKLAQRMQVGFAPPLLVCSYSYPFLSFPPSPKNPHLHSIFVLIFCHS